MLLHGLTITIVGMAIVFAFLILLVLTMNLLSAFLRKYLPNSLKPSEKDLRGEEDLPGKPQEDLAEIAAVIAATQAHILSRYRG